MFAVLPNKHPKKPVFNRIASPNRLISDEVRAAYLLTVGSFIVDFYRSPGCRLLLVDKGYLPNRSLFERLNYLTVDDPHHKNIIYSYSIILWIEVNQVKPLFIKNKNIARQPVYKRTFMLNV
jgi:hypothetical protein